MTDFAHIDTFTIIRKPRVVVQAFVCVICRRDIQDDEWQARQSYNKPPLCGSCTGHWSQPFGVIPKITNGDRIALRRLKAVTTCLNWEIHNGTRA